MSFKTLGSDVTTMTVEVVPLLVCRFQQDAKLSKQCISPTPVASRCLTVGV